MVREKRHNLLICLLALAVVFAPVQSAVSAIEMLDHSTGGSQHCQMEMADHGEADSMHHGGCCKHDGSCQDNCSSCTQCISVHAGIISQTIQVDRPSRLFIPLLTGLYKGIPPGAEFRPPRIFS